MRVGVIGAGPAGISAGYELSKAGVEVHVLEAGTAVGGMARTIELWGQRVDLGPHRFFSSDRRVNRVWMEALGSDYAMVDRLTRIYYNGRFFNYPLKISNVLANLGPFESLRCMASYAREQALPGATEDGTFEDWVVNRFGRRLFEIFFKTYSEKLWGIPCSELDADFAAQRIKKLSLLEAVKNALVGGKGNIHKTLVEQFAYPTGGSGLAYERMAEMIRAHGGRVRLSSPVRRVLTRDGHAYGVELESGEVTEFDHVISTMPLSLMVRGLDGVPAAVREACGNLSYRNTILVYLNVGSEGLFPDNWVYVHSADLKVGRITNFRNWVPEIRGRSRTSILALEYWCYDGDEEWVLPEHRLIERAKQELRATGLIGDAVVLEGHVHRIRRCYPVYRHGYKNELDRIIPFIKSIKNLTAIGRYGAFKYNNQDHSILMGILAAENIARGAAHDLWSVNTDYESYQESEELSEVGLASPGEPEEKAA